MGHQGGRTHFRYTQYINRMHRRSGHLWQNRFFSCALDEVHLWRALCYVERNPVRAKAVRVGWRYRWSSAAAHVGQGDTSGLLDLDGWIKQWKSEAWRDALRERQDDRELSWLRLSTHRGRPLATDSFLSRLEHKLGRRLRPLPVGRPKKPKPTSKRAGRHSRVTQGL